MNRIFLAVRTVKRPAIVCGTWMLFCLALFSCKKTDALSDVPQPIKDIITQSTSCNCEPFIDRYRWRDQTVYLMSCKGPACFCMVRYYDAKGNQFVLPSGYRYTDFDQEAAFLKNIWTCGK